MSAIDATAKGRFHQGICCSARAIGHRGIRMIIGTAWDLRESTTWCLSENTTGRRPVIRD